MAEHLLRDLARQIEALAKEHPAYSQAQPIVQHCIDYLCAVARCHECNAEVERLRKPPIMSVLREKGWP